MVPARPAPSGQQAAALMPEDQLGMILFADRSEYIHSPMAQREYSLKAIDGYRAQGGTALYDAVYDSLAQIADVKGRRVVVVVTDGRDENAASNGPGSLRAWEDVTALAADYQKILDELRRRYVVGYESTNRARNGEWRKVEVSVRQRDVTIRSRGGYFAPNQ